MTIAHEFNYLRPDTLDEALGVLAESSGETQVLAGGTDLVPWLRDEAIAPELVVDIKGIEGLDEITPGATTVSVGCLVTFADLLRSATARDQLPLLVEAAGTVGSTGIRNRATLVGNICSAVPSCDAGPALLSYEAEVEIAGEDGFRRIPIGDWFRGPRRTALGRAEIVTRVIVPIPEERHGAAYVRLSRYRGEDLAQACVAIVVTGQTHYRVAFGAVSPTPLRAPQVEALLDGKSLSEGLVEEAAALVRDEISPISDIRASSEYRLHMCEVMLRRGLWAAESRLTGDGPRYGERLV
jgi:carbon-monoxide dehydrogenase medium subunit